MWAFFSMPVVVAPWGALRDFWLTQVFDDRFVVVYFLPLMPILMLLRRDRLRVGIVLTCLLFLAYVFGVLYAGLWLLTCLGLYALSEKFAVECRRTDVLPIGPPLAAGGALAVWYIATMALHRVDLAPGLNAWLFEHARWVFPLGARRLAFEPFFWALHDRPNDPAPGQLLRSVFWNVHSIGAAYLAVRMLQYFSEIKRGNLPDGDRGLLRFLAFTCYAPTLIQGPIERYVEFNEQIDTCHERRSWGNVPYALARMGLGVVKSVVGTIYLQPFVVGPLGLSYANTYYLHPERVESFTLLYFGVTLQILWLYLEFSGYCDVAVGMSRLLGYRVFENFRHPWLSTSFRDFWRRWHLSLSFILRDYVYIALGGNRRHAMLNILITFVLCGVWHALSAQAALWGLLMGVMVAINQWWVKWMERLDAAPVGTLPAIRRWWIGVPVLPQVCAWLVTMHAFMLTLLVLFGGGGAWNVVREIGRRVLE